MDKGSVSGSMATQRKVRDRDLRKVVFAANCFRGLLGAVLRHAGGRRDPSVLHGTGAGTVQQEGGDHLLGTSRAALQR